jgi:5-methylcytosine-specific restriction endonuclease McrA
MKAAQRRRIRDRLMTHYGGRCFYCGTVTVSSDGTGPHLPQEATIDHIIPRSKGGRNRLTNAVLSCRACNNARADTDFVEFVIRTTREATP